MEAEIRRKAFGEQSHARHHLDERRRDILDRQLRGHHSSSLP
jgi:hypothetical protein